jgi:hypothetical protein
VAEAPAELAAPLGPALASAPGDIYELVIYNQETANNHYAINVFHFKAITSGCTATSLIADFRANMETSYRALLVSAAVINRYVAFNLVPYNTDWAEQRVSLAGTAGATMAPPLVAAIITWRTSLPGRRYRGRTYFGPLTTSDIQNGKILGGVTVGKWNTFGTNMLNRYGATGTSTDTRVGVWSRVLGNQTPPHNAAGFTQITQFQTQTNLGSMGTRRVGRGM